MKNVDLEILIDKNKYQVFVCSSPAAIPVNFFRHTWFVVNKKGVLSRYEILHRKRHNSGIPGFSNIGYFYKNSFPPFLGLSVFFPFVIKDLRWEARIDCELSGEQELIKKVIDEIESSETNYPYINKYNFLGPNSNSYPVWIMNKFPEIKFKLPYNAIGKNFFNKK